MHYLFLGLAVVAETIGTTVLKLSDGFSKPLPAIAAICCFAVALFLMSLVLRVMPVGIVYAIWSGLGITFITLIGWLWFDERLDVPALVGIGLIISGVAVINLLSASTTH